MGGGVGGGVEELRGESERSHEAIPGAPGDSHSGTSRRGVHGAPPGMVGDRRPSAEWGTRDVSRVTGPCGFCDPWVFHPKVVGAGDSVVSREPLVALQILFG